MDLPVLLMYGATMFLLGLLSGDIGIPWLMDRLGGRYGDR